MIFSGIAVVLLLIGGFVGYMLKTAWFRVESIQVSSGVVLSPQTITDQQLNQHLQVLQDTSLLLIDVPTVEKDLLDSFPALSYVSLTKKYPNALELVYLPHVPIAQINTGQSSYLVNNLGLVFSDVASQTLPSITVDEASIATGTKLSSKGLLLSMSLIQSLARAQIKLQSIILQDRQLQIKIEQAPEILVGQDQEAEQTALVIADLIKRAQDQQPKPRLIDLRFNRPVMVY